MPKSTKVKNERSNEALVRALLSKNGYSLIEKAKNGTVVEEQATMLAPLARLLKNASKTGGQGVGKPEFIIRNQSAPDLIVLVECKANTADHGSAEANQWVGGQTPDMDDSYHARATRYAIDGVLHYARFASKGFNVIAVAASGETQTAFKLETFLWTKGAKAPTVLLNRKKGSEPLNAIVPWGDFALNASYDPTVSQARLAELMTFARDLHDTLRVYKLNENDKPLLVSGTLLALHNKVFNVSLFGAANVAGEIGIPAKDLPNEWCAAIAKELERANIQQEKQNDMMAPFRNLATHPSLKTVNDEHPHGVFFSLIRDINEHVAPFNAANNSLDVLGKFYGEFLKYSGGDKKALGIVLTPRHITELFSEIAQVNHKKSVVLDLCAGTCGFLVSAMTHMLRDTKTAAEEDRVKAEGLVGVEQDPKMFALAASNMILRGDGKTNLFQGDCFDSVVVAKVKEKRPNVGMLNPPYAQKDRSELEFIEQMLDVLEPHSVGVAIVPMSAALENGSVAKKSLLSKHTLEAVMSMPDDLFYPVGTVTCIMVFTAHKPHTESNRDTWFGFWKNDGFTKVKHIGRVDRKGNWDTIRGRWLDAFRNRRAIPGESVLRKVGAADEWCAEAYMETDYSTLMQADFERTVLNYVMFKTVCEHQAAPRPPVDRVAA